YYKKLEDIVANLDGHFFLVIVDRLDKKIYFITDHIGLINIYEHKIDGKIFISSSALSLSKTFSVTLNSQAVCQFLRTGSISNSDTIYNEINLLEPSTIYSYDFANGNYQIHKKEYWKAPTEIDENSSFKDTCKRFSEILENRVSLFANQNIISDFTGGFDSRLVSSSLMNANSSSNTSIITFVFGPSKSKEVKLVKEISQKLNIKNVHLNLPESWIRKFPEYIIRSLNICDGEENAFNYAPILFANESKAKYFTFSVNGLGGELYRDFWWVQELFFKKKPANIRRLVTTRVLQYEYDFSIFKSNWRQSLESVVNVYEKNYMLTNSDMQNTYNTLQIDNIYLRQKIRRWAGRTISSSNQIINTIAPLLFKDCLEAGMVVPPKYKRNGRFVRAVIENANPFFAEMKMLNGIPCKPMRIDNFYEFFPAFNEMFQKGLRKISQNLLNKTIYLDKSLNYNQASWFEALKNQFCEDKMFNQLINLNIIDRKKILPFVRKAGSPEFPFFSQLGNMITLELRMQQDKIDV
ncbi:MAG: hypothetical protein R6U40_09650, partial [Desulfobacterales bacterium]